MQDSVRDEVRRLWQQHLDRPFPPRLRGEEVDGIDMVMLDADIAGCVDTWLGSSSDLDTTRLAILRACLHDVDRVLPSLSDHSERAYYSALRDLAINVVEAHDGPSE